MASESARFGANPRPAVQGMGPGVERPVESSVQKNQGGIQKSTEKFLHPSGRTICCAGRTFPGILLLGKIKRHFLNETLI